MAQVENNPPVLDSSSQPILKVGHGNVPTHLSEGAARMEGNTNLHQSEKDKLQMIEIITGIHQGKMPSNAQFSYFLEELANIRAIHERQHLMSPDGQRLLLDFRNLIQTLQKALNVKNHDQLFQSLYHHLYSVDYQKASTQGKLKLTSAAGTSGGQVKSELKEGASAIMSILKLVVTNGEFRRQLNELISIAQEVFSDATDKMDSSLQHVTQKVDETAQHMNDRFQDYAEEGHNQLSNVNEDGADNTHLTDIKQHIHDRVNDAHQRQPEHQEQAKEEIQDQAKKAKQYARDKFPPERVDAIVNRLKLVLSEVQRRPKYREAIGTLFGLTQTWSDRLANVGQHGANQAQNATSTFRSEPNWSSAENELKTILEDWSQGQSMDPFLISIQTIVTDVKNDDHLRRCYNESTDYLRRLAEEPGYASTDQSTEDGKCLVRRVRQVTEGRYRSNIDFMIHEAKSFLRAMNEDPMARELEDAFKQIHRDLWYDSDGNVAFKPQLLTDMRITLIPAFLEFIKVVPIPKVEYSDPQFDVAVENIILPGDTLLPSLVEMKMDNYIKFSPYTNVTNANQQGIWMKMSQITTEIKNVIWYYKKKTGFPRLTDRGAANVTIGGTGLTVTARIISNSTDPVHMFRVAQCNARISNLKVKVMKSKHNMLYRTVQPLMTSIVKRQITRAVEAKVKEVIENADSHLTAIMMQHYKDSLTKTETWTDLATANQSQPQQQQQRVAVDAQGQPIATKDKLERPSLTTAVITILNRNMKSNMVRGIQEQKAKHQQRKDKKKAKDDHRQQDDNEATTRSSNSDRRGDDDFGTEQYYPARQAPQQDQYGGGGGSAGVPRKDDDNIIPVIFSKDGGTYITDDDTGRLVPVDVSREAYKHIQEDQQQQQQQQAKMDQGHTSSGYGSGVLGNKRTSQDIGGNQDYTHHQTTGPAPNVM